MKLKNISLLFCLLIFCFSVFAEEPGVDIMPAVVIKTIPKAGAVDVDPNLSDITVEFSKIMLIDRYSWVSQSEDSKPEIIGSPKYLEDKKTCVAKVKLKPNKTYIIWFNNDKFQNFQDLGGRPSLPYVLTFKTKKE